MLPEWMQVDLGTEKRVTGVVTQGRSDVDEWVLEYRVEYSLNGKHFRPLGAFADETSALSHTFPGTTEWMHQVAGVRFAGRGELGDKDTLVRNQWFEEVVARYVRIFPLRYGGSGGAGSGHPSLRADIEAESIHMDNKAFSFGDSKGTEVHPAPSASFGAMVTAKGGQYRLCWCAGSQQGLMHAKRSSHVGEHGCSAIRDFRTDLGELVIVGPSPLNQDRTCVAGQTCRVDGLTGIHLRSEDPGWS
jgi:hypothetical protein